MEGPYRDLGSGFARLTGVEGARRSPSRISSVEDALFELLRNARDAGARNVYVASTLHRRRYRTLTVLDDGRGIPEDYAALIFEPGVTTRHLQPAPEPTDHPAVAPHGAGMSLYHIKNVSLDLEVCSPSGPTSLKMTFDTRYLPERSLQSGSRPSRSNLVATLHNFLRHHTTPGQITAYYGSPARILARLLQNHIIQTREDGWEIIGERASSLGIRVSAKTIRRIRGGGIPPAGNVAEGMGMEDEEGKDREGSTEPKLGGARIFLGKQELSGIAAILREAARSSYLEVGEVELDSRPGEIVLKAHVYEPEDEYE